MHTAMQSFNSSGPSPFSLIFGSCRSPFLHQAGHSGPMALNQAHYALKSNLFRARSDFFAMTRFTSAQDTRSEEHTSELQSRENLVCRLLLEKKKKSQHYYR